MPLGMNSTTKSRSFEEGMGVKPMRLTRRGERMQDRIFISFSTSLERASGGGRGEGRLTATMRWRRWWW